MTASTVARANQTAVQAPASAAANTGASVAIVEVDAYGGSDSGDPSQPQDNQPRKKPDQRSSYDPNSPYQVLGVGELTDGGTQSLANDTRKRLTPANP